MPIETEIKLRIPEPLKEPAQVILAKNFRFFGKFVEEVVFFEIPDYAKDDLSTFRVKEITACADGHKYCSVNTKGFDRGENGILERTENQFQSNGGFCKILSMMEILGHKEVLRYTKIRDSWSDGVKTIHGFGRFDPGTFPDGSFKVELDFIPKLGTFLEIETSDMSSRSMERIIRDLNLEGLEIVDKSYYELIKEREKD